MGKEGRLQRFREEGFNKLKQYINNLTEERYEFLMTADNYRDVLKGCPLWIINNIDYYRDAENAEKEYESLYNNVKPLLDKISPDININNFPEYTSELDKIYELYDKYREEFLSYRKDFEPYLEKIERESNLKSQLETEYYTKYIEDNIDIVPEEDRGAFLEALHKDGNLFGVKDSRKYNKIFGYTLNSIVDVEAFSTEAENRLNDPDIGDWVKDSIIRDRIEYFKSCGIDLGSNYEDYLNNEDVRKIWPDKDRIDRLIESRDDILNKFNIEFYQGLDSHKETRREIDELGLENKDDNFDARIYTSSTPAFVSPNIRRVNGAYDIFCLLVVNLERNDGLLDHFICHELNHLFEMSLGEVLGDEFTSLCGWDPCCDKIIRNSQINVDTINEDKNKRDYELFNEIINELLAQDISEIMHKRNIHVFDDPETATYKHGTSYEASMYIIRDFYKEFKEKIIESRRNGNINIIFDEVGKENFDALNELFAIHNEHFGGMKIYGLYDSLKENKDDENTRVYYEICDKRDEILRRMREHSMSRKEEMVNESINY